jgi:hypothetical protein
MRVQQGSHQWKQYVKAFLREMAVVREHVCETFTAHHLHRHTICEAVFLVGTGLVESETCKEELTGLWNDCHVWRGKKTMDSQRRSLAEIRFSGAVGRKVLVEYRIRGIQVCGVSVSVNAITRRCHWSAACSNAIQ